MIVDIHTFIGHHPIHDFRQEPQEILAVMEKFGVDKSFVLPFPTMKIKNANDRVAEAVNLLPDRLVGFACIDPSTEEAVEETRRAVGLNLRGIMLDPEFHGVFPNVPRLEKLMVACMENDLVVLFNTPNIKALSVHDGYHNGLDRLAFKYPDIRLVVSPFWPKLSDLMKKHANIIIDTGGHHNVPGWIPLLEEVGPARFCLGSESPINHPAMVIKNIRTRKMEPAFRDLILGKNAERIFKDLL